MTGSSVTAAVTMTTVMATSTPSHAPAGAMWTIIAVRTVLNGSPLADIIQLKPKKRS